MESIYIILFTKKSMLKCDHFYGEMYSSLYKISIKHFVRVPHELSGLHSSNQSDFRILAIESGQASLSNWLKSQ